MFRKIQILWITALLIFICQPAALAASDYTVTNYSVYMDIQTDGSAYVTETLSYAFDGDYSNITYQVDAAEGSRIVDLNVYLDGAAITRSDTPTYIENSYTVTESENSTHVQIYSPGNNDTRLVTYEYHLTEFAERYADTGMIHYAFISEDHKVHLQNAILTVHFQGASGNLENIVAFARGGMDVADIKVHDNVIEFGSAALFPDDYVEVRLLFPAEYVDSAPLIDQAVRQAILEEEQRLDAESARRAFVLRVAKQVYFVAYTLIFFIVWLCFVRRYRMKGALKETPDPQRVLNFPAAFAAAVVQDEPDCNAAAGTLLELIQLGHIRIAAGADKKELYFTLLDSSRESLYPHQLKLIEWLFDDRDSFMLSDLSAANYDQAQLFERGLAAYCEQVVADMHDRKLKHHNDLSCILVSTLIIIFGILGCGGMLLASQSDVVLGSIMICIMFCLIHLMNRIRRLTDAGERLLSDARALLNHEIPSGDDMLPFLPYYTALGMTESLIHAVESCRLNNQICHEPDYLFIGWHHALRALSTALRSAHQHNASMPRSDGEFSDPSDLSDDI